MHAPLFDEHLGFLQRVEDFPVQQLVAKLPDKPLVIGGAARSEAVSAVSFAVVACMRVGIQSCNYSKTVSSAS